MLINFYYLLFIYYFPHHTRTNTIPFFLPSFLRMSLSWWEPILLLFSPDVKKEKVKKRRKRKKCWFEKKKRKEASSIERKKNRPSDRLRKNGINGNDDELIASCVKHNYWTLFFCFFFFSAFLQRTSLWNFFIFFYFLPLKRTGILIIHHSLRLYFNSKSKAIQQT